MISAAGCRRRRRATESRRDGRRRTLRFDEFVGTIRWLFTLGVLTAERDLRLGEILNEEVGRSVTTD